ncbi:PREDICTED: C2 and GRAM domain-containing protein At5g50170-like [Tarenaya hassleriana]|uniref:C2 and GRAM domain-containing protein At5g50170-like n=1 Tax=Tarenaya hassleriana TaxID=28532 RepID=UPI00053C6992|nr:PREDICTED: C2 and GRAM domain-containing protein At5g50170-like [Tarenaya hassleriana]XP_010534151.1 PREDICTED: C2 and GRAM domain-containing protein At5g50170-like [Tarenaya hassleriana]
MVSPKGRKHHGGKKLMKAIVSNLDKLCHKKEDDASKGNDNDSSDHISVSNNKDSPGGFSIPSACTGFEDGLDLMQSRDRENDEMPENLPGGVLVNQNYLVSPRELNIFLFSSSSQFRREFAEIQGTKDLHEGPWRMKPGDPPALTRILTYMTAPKKIMKSVKATEEQVYLKATGRYFAVHVSISTPDLLYGNAFKSELLYKIQPGTKLPSGEESSQLIVSWGIRFHQSTMMKGMIEGGAKQVMKEGYTQFSDFLSKKYKTLDSVGFLDKDQILATLSEQKSDLKSAFRYFWRFHVICPVVMFLYVMAHILQCEPNKVQGFEFCGLDLPDSLGELFTVVVLALLLQRVYRTSLHFIQAKVHDRGSDHGSKATGKGWILTVALIKSMDLASVTRAELSDPYVVFTCRGKRRTSSVKLQTQDPEWNEVIEFDAMEEPPSVLDVEVFDFDGPLDDGESLGHAEVNFLRHSSDELADLWVPLEGNLAKASKSKLHLRIFLENNNGIEAMKNFFIEVEKEVGTKLSIQSPRKNSAFQKLFGLPHEEFLVKEYTCQLKRKLPLQGKIFLSARIVAFCSSFFGHKTKFYFLWEDIDEIRVLPRTFSSLLLIILKQDRGLDAKHGAKSRDEKGRLCFYFQSFVTFYATCRIIMALWKKRMSRTEHMEEEDTMETAFFPKTRCFKCGRNSRFRRFTSVN